MRSFIVSFSFSFRSLLLAASRTRNASKRYRELVRIKGDNKRGGNETVVSERNEDRAISYRTPPSARKQFIPLHCSTLIRPRFSFHFSDSVPSPTEIFWSRLLRSPAPHAAYELRAKTIFFKDKKKKRKKKREVESNVTLEKNHICHRYDLSSLLYMHCHRYIYHTNFENLKESKESLVILKY